MSLSGIEQETIVNFNEAETSASVYTFNGSFKKKLRVLSEDFPQDVICERIDEYGGATYSMPKKWIKINAPKILSEEQKTALRERLQSNLRQKSSTTVEETET